MTSRERVLVALEGGTPDRVPCALGFFALDLKATAPAGWDLRDHVDVDFVRFAPSPEEAELRRVGLPFRPDTRVGSIAQVAHYTRWSYHPENAERRNPLARAESLADLEAFPFPDPCVPAEDDSLAAQVESIHARGLAAGGNLPHLGGELLEAAWRLRGLENFLLDIVERPDWAHFLLDRLTDLACRNARCLAQAGVDVLLLDDDVGMPGTMMVSPGAWREFFKPRFARIVASARALRPELRTVFHSDGFFEPIVGDLMEIGIDGINPLQPEFMDAVAIRRRYGPRLALWGTVGRQTSFSFAEPSAIGGEVRLRMRELGPAGLILSPAYDVDEPDVPWPNVAAFLESARQEGSDPG